jgi:hypothetical protein
MGFFERAKKGDLVLVPPSSIFSRVLIGEILDDDFEEITIPEVWEREKVPSRRVHWLATPLRGECSIELQRRFPSPNTVRLLDREARAEVYSMAYGSYSIADSFTCKFDVTSADFTTIDDYRLQQLLNSIAALSLGLIVSTLKSGSNCRIVASRFSRSRTIRRRDSCAFSISPASWARRLTSPETTKAFMPRTVAARAG